MTTIVAVKDPSSNAVVVASDSAFYGRNTFVAHGDKFIKNSLCACAFGNAGRAIYDDWIMTEPDILAGRPTVYELRTSLQKLFERHGAKVKHDDEGLPRWGLEAIYVRAPDIFLLDSAMCCTKVENFGAVGSGTDFALGAMEALWSDDAKAEWVAEKAISVAMKLDPWTAGYYLSVTLEHK